MDIVVCVAVDHMLTLLLLLFSSQMEMPMACLLSSMEVHGVGFQRDAVPRIIGLMDDKKEALAQQIHAQAGCAFNVSTVLPHIDIHKEEGPPKTITQHPPLTRPPQRRSTVTNVAPSPASLPPLPCHVTTSTQVDSPEQVADVLYTRLRLPAPSTTQGAAK